MSCTIESILGSKVACSSSQVIIIIIIIIIIIVAIIIIIIVVVVNPIRIRGCLIKKIRETSNSDWTDKRNNNLYGTACNFRS